MVSNKAGFDETPLSNMFLLLFSFLLLALPDFPTERKKSRNFRQILDIKIPSWKFVFIEAYAIPAVIYEKPKKEKSKKKRKLKSKEPATVFWKFYFVGKIETRIAKSDYR